MKNNLKILGLIAGNGKFPFLFAREARRQGIKVVAIAIKGDTSRLLKGFVDKLFWVNPGELKKLFEFFKKQDVRQVLMAGQVNPKNLFDEKIVPDDEFKDLFLAMKDRKADTIFNAVAERLKAQGMELLDSTLFLKEYMAPKGTLTKRGPTQIELEDVQFGQSIAKAMGSVDVGQTVVVKEKAIVAVEAMEGTDCTILRGGQIARQGAVVVKMSKPAQDNRFDVPVVGPRTVKTMKKAKATCLAIEAGKTIIIDQRKCIQLCNKANICLVAA